MLSVVRCNKYAECEFSTCEHHSPHVEIIFNEHSSKLPTCKTAPRICFWCNRGVVCVEVSRICKQCGKVHI